MESHAEKLYTPVALATADGVRVIATPGAKAATQSNADAIIQSLEARGIQHIFLVPGKLVYPLIKSIEHSGIAGIVGAHETACGFMADGYARASRKFGVCLGISGPGTMNFLPAMAAAQADKIPVLYLAGGIATYHEAQGAFQDGSNSGIDELTIVKPLLSAAIEVKNNLTLQHELRRSLSCLNTQRKGRTYLSVPVDMQKKEVAGGHDVSPPRTPQCREAAIDPQALDQVLDDYLLRGLNVACLVGNRMIIRWMRPCCCAWRRNTVCRLPLRCPARARFPKGTSWRWGCTVLPDIPGRWKPSMAMKWMCCWCWVAI